MRCNQPLVHGAAGVVPGLLRHPQAARPREWAHGDQSVSLSAKLSARTSNAALSGGPGGEPPLYAITDVHKPSSQVLSGGGGWYACIKQARRTVTFRDHPPRADQEEQPPSPRPDDGGAAVAALPLPPPAADVACARDGLASSQKACRQAVGGSSLREWVTTRLLDEDAASSNTSGRLVLQLLLPDREVKVVQGWLASQAADVLCLAGMAVGSACFGAVALSTRVPVGVSQGLALLHLTSARCLLLIDIKVLAGRPYPSATVDSSGLTVVCVCWPGAAWLWPSGAAAAAPAVRDLLRALQLRAAPLHRPRCVGGKVNHPQSVHGGY